ncbi:MAG: hypothetical protein WA705_11280 [Candidatus Ozemobacteraceae bacterium]
MNQSVVLTPSPGDAPEMRLRGEAHELFSRARGMLEDVNEEDRRDLELLMKRAHELLAGPLDEDSQETLDEIFSEIDDLLIFIEEE